MQFHQFPAKALATLAFAALAAGNAQAQNLITNGGFETGNLSGWTSSIGSGGGRVGALVNEGHSGSFAATMRGLPEIPNSQASISQSFDTTAGTQYELSFWSLVGGRGGGLLSASLNGARVFEDRINDSDYVFNTLSFTATGARTTLTFTGLGPAGALVDDISVVAVVPEPAEWGLLTAGLLAVGTVVRRRRAA